jgi:hypothetical protein
MVELAARRYSPSPERWIEHPQNPSAFDPRQRDDLTGRQIGLRPAWGGPPVPNRDASRCGTNAWQKSSTSQKTSTIRSNIIAFVTQRWPLTSKSLSVTIP